MIPNVTITKLDGQTGVVRPGADGILLILAPSEKGQLVPASYAKTKDVSDEYGAGLLPEFASFVLDRTKKPIVAVRGSASVAAVLGAVTAVGAGTSVVTVSGAPLDDYRGIVKVIAGGTIGVSGATYKYSLDGGVNWSAEFALGVAVSVVLPGSGVTVNFAAGTLLADSTFSFAATAARFQNSDIVTALEAIRTSTLRFEALLVAGPLDATMVATIQTWVTAREAEGRYYTFLGSPRWKTSVETEAAYKAALDPIFAATVAASGLVCADSFEATSAITGRVQQRDFALAVAARSMAVDIGVSPSWVALGPLDGCVIKDAKGNPLHHDEAQSPGLSDTRFTVARTFGGQDDPEGTFINLPLLFSQAGSDYVIYPHMRVMNRACSIAKQLLTKRLQSGVEKVPDPNIPNKAVIAEAEAAEIESEIVVTLRGELTESKKRASDAGFVLSRSDDLSSNGLHTLTGDVWIVPLAYVGKFDIGAKFVRRPVQATA